MTLPPRDIVRFLLLIGSPACRGDKRVMLAAVAAINGLSCRARYGGPVSENMAEPLTPLVRAPSRPASFDSSARVRVAAIRTSESGEAPCLLEA
jgi:hypothetical protein